MISRIHVTGLLLHTLIYKSLLRPSVSVTSLGNIQKHSIILNRRYGITECLYFAIPLSLRFYNALVKISKLTLIW
ncbi:MAG: hypothetical protein OXT67_13580 [Zetaproteobacteria bacterium]|nr:hypothetical protein [Zetaproteobacteria bacterium]